MFITVDEALSLPSMRGAVLIAGKEGLSKRISSVNIMEVPGIADFVKPEELVITTMYPIRDNEDLQAVLVPNLVEKRVSALAIVPLDHDRDIPVTMIKLAEEHAFPLIKLPRNTSFNEIINPILELILERKHIEVEHRFKARIIGDLLSGKITTKSQIMSLVKYYDWDFIRAFLPVIVKLDLSKHDKSQLQLHKFSDISEKFGMPGTIVADFDFGILLLFPYSDAKRQRGMVHRILAQYLEIFPMAYIGIGKTIGDILELPKGLREAHQVADISEKIPKFGHIADFNDLGVYRVLVLGDDDDLKNKQDFVREKLSDLTEYDKSHKTNLLLTLQVFFDEGDNLRKAAEKLFIHHNTMSNRLKLIEKIAQIDLSVQESRLEMMIAIKLAAIL